MKQIIEKYKMLMDALEDSTDIDRVTRDDLRKCLAIYVNGEILIAFNNYTKKQKIISADMIAFFYLHLQMSGAANESLRRDFTGLHSDLSDVLFDNTVDGKGAARLSRFAGAHSTSLSALLNGFNPKLLHDYILLMKDVRAEIERCILSYLPKLGEVLRQVAEISFSPMLRVDFSSPQFKINAQQIEASCLLESVKSIDIAASIFDETVQTEFLNSASGQALAIMARQIVANNVFILLKNGTLSHHADFTELRQYRNCSAHGIVMWEIQDNPVQLRFNCMRLVLCARDTLVSQLKVLSPTVYGDYLNPPNVELKVSEEPCELTQQVEKTKVKKKKNKLPKSVVLHTSQEKENSECLVLFEKQTKQSIIMRNLIASFYNNSRKVDAIMKLKSVLETLNSCHAIIPESFIHGINESLVGKATRNLVNNGRYYSYIRFSDDQGVAPFDVALHFDPVAYPSGFKEVNLNFIFAPLSLMTEGNMALFNKQENLALFKQVLQKAFDHRASPNCVIQAHNGLYSILSFAIINNFPADVIAFLLENGANVNNIIGNTLCVSPLTHAVIRSPDIVPLLLHAGANPLDITYDPNAPLNDKSSIFYDILSELHVPAAVRNRSLKILCTHAFQKYGGKALLASMNAPLKLYKPNKKPELHDISKLYELIESLPTREQLLRNPELYQAKFTREDAMPVLVLHQKVVTVLSNPRFDFYKLILNGEIEILVQEIVSLNSPKKILAAMGIAEGVEEVHSGKKFPADQFASDLGLMPLALYLGRVRSFCLAPSLKMCTSMTNYFSRMETCIYSCFPKEFSCMHSSGPSIFALVADYWGMKAGRQSVAYHCL